MNTPSPIAFGSSSLVLTLAKRLIFTEKRLRLQKEFSNDYIYRGDEVTAATVEYFEAQGGDGNIFCQLCKKLALFPTKVCSRISCCTTICNHCLNNLLSFKLPCPTCKGSLLWTSVDEVVEELVSSIKIKCWKKGCDEIIDASQLEEHFYKECEFNLPVSMCDLSSRDSIKDETHSSGESYIEKLEAATRKNNRALTLSGKTSIDGLLTRKPATRFTHSYGSRKQPNFDHLQKYLSTPEISEPRSATIERRNTTEMEEAPKRRSTMIQNVKETIVFALDKTRSAMKLLM